MYTKVTIEVQDYAKKHYIKSYKKKYKVARDKTYRTICLMLERAEKFFK